MNEQLNKLMYWEFVSPNEEYEKYFRYNCFQKKWLKIAKNKDKARYYLNLWVKKAATGEDIVVNLVNLIKETTDISFQTELVEAALVISEGSTKGLTRAEIAEAKKIATQLWQQSVVEESLLEQFDD